jgi:hypothetical protein
MSLAIKTHKRSRINIETLIAITTIYCQNMVDASETVQKLYLKKTKGFYLKSIKRPMTDDQTLKSAEITLL